jgi:hypothetical protein
VNLFDWEMEIKWKRIMGIWGRLIGGIRLMRMKDKRVIKTRKLFKKISKNIREMKNNKIFKNTLKINMIIMNKIKIKKEEMYKIKDKGKVKDKNKKIGMAQINNTNKMITKINT